MDEVKGSGDRLLVGTRSVPALAAGGSASRSLAVTVPSSTPADDYWVFACADDTKAVTESDETNDRRAAAARVRVTP